MPIFSKADVILVRYPFSDRIASKVRPAIVVGSLDRSDHLVVPLTSRTTDLALGEFVLSDWKGAGLNLPSAVKQGIYTINAGLIIKSVGRLSPNDQKHVDQSLRRWLGIT